MLTSVAIVNPELYRVYRANRCCQFKKMHMVGTTWFGDSFTCTDQVFLPSDWSPEETQIDLGMKCIYSQSKSHLMLIIYFVFKTVLMYLAEIIFCVTWSRDDSVALLYFFVLCTSVSFHMCSAFSSGNSHKQLNGNTVRSRNNFQTYGFITIPLISKPSVTRLPETSRGRRSWKDPDSGGSLFGWHRISLL